MSHSKTPPAVFEKIRDIARQRGGSITKGWGILAHEIGYKGWQIWQKWEDKGAIPAESARPVESATGIPRHQIRPDLWDGPC